VQDIDGLGAVGDEQLWHVLAAGIWLDQSGKKSFCQYMGKKALNQDFESKDLVGDGEVNGNIESG